MSSGRRALFAALLEQCGSTRAGLNLGYYRVETGAAKCCATGWLNA